MKKYITMLIGMVMAFCFYGCSDDVPSNPYKEYDLPIDCKGLNIEMGKAILIQNESDFNALFSSYQNLMTQKDIIIIHNSPKFNKLVEFPIFY